MLCLAGASCGVWVSGWLAVSPRRGPSPAPGDPEQPCADFHPAPCPYLQGVTPPCGVFSWGPSSPQRVPALSPALHPWALSWRWMQGWHCTRPQMHHQNNHKHHSSKLGGKLSKCWLISEINKIWRYLKIRKLHRTISTLLILQGKLKREK